MSMKKEELGNEDSVMMNIRAASENDLAAMYLVYYSERSGRIWELT